MKKEFLIKNKSGAVSSLTIALIYVIFVVVTIVTEMEMFGQYGGLEYVFLVIAFVVIVLDVVDLYKMKNDKLVISFKDDRVTLALYWFNNKEYYYDKMEQVGLAEKEIHFMYEGKKRSIGYLSKSDFIRAMKILKDNCEE